MYMANQMQETTTKHDKIAYQASISNAYTRLEGHPEIPAGVKQYRSHGVMTNHK